MDKSRVKQVVEANLGPLKRAFGIPHWHVSVEYGPVDEDGNAADCTRKLDYHMAHIRIDPERMPDPEYVAKILAHELFHVVLSPFDLYRKFATAGMERGSTEDQQDDAVWDHAVEQVAINLQRMYEGVRAIERRAAASQRRQARAKARKGKRS